MYPLKHLFRISKGFTLLESLVAMVVLSFAIAVIFYAFNASMRLFTNELSESDASFQAHKAVETMSNELRGAIEIVSANGTSITFMREAYETVTYSWTGTAEGLLNRTVQTSTQEIATGIKGFTLTYNDPTPSNIRLIKILVTVQKDSTLSTLESSVKCRNL